MKFLIGIIFFSSVLLFTCFSRSCGDYQKRLQSHIVEDLTQTLDEIPGDKINASVHLYDTTLEGEVGSREEAEAVVEQIAGNLPVGKARIHNGLRYAGEAVVETGDAGDPKIASTPPVENAVSPDAVDNPTPASDAKLEDPVVAAVDPKSEGSVETELPITPKVTPAPPVAIAAADVVNTTPAKIEAVPTVPVPEVVKDTSTPLIAAVTPAQTVGSAVAEVVESPTVDEPKEIAPEPSPAVEPEPEDPKEKPAEVAEETPKKATPVPEVISSINVKSADDSPIDNVALLADAEVTKGDPFTPKVIEKLKRHLDSQEGIEASTISFNVGKNGYELVATVTASSEPEPVVIATSAKSVFREFNYAVFGEQRIDTEILEKATALKFGDPIGEEELAAAQARIESLPIVQKVQITAEGDKLQINVLSMPLPKAALEDEAATLAVVSDIEIVLEDGAKVKQRDAMKALGIKKGDAYHPEHVKAAQEALLKLEGVESAMVEPEYRNGSFSLTARLRGDQPDMDSVLNDLNVYFETGSTYINAAAKAKLEKAAAVILRSGKRLKIDVAGFADARGDINANRKLSNRRAEGVAKALTDLGVDRALVSTRGDGVPGAESLEQQRRVEVRLAPKN